MSKAMALLEVVTRSRSGGTLEIEAASEVSRHGNATCWISIARIPFPPHAASAFSVPVELDYGDVRWRVVGDPDAEVSGRILPTGALPHST